MFQGKSSGPNTGFLDKIRAMAVSGHQTIYGGDEGLRHHLCVSHGEHFDEGTPRAEMEERHDEEHPYSAGHRGEWGCYEHDPSDEPTEFHDMHESGGIGEIHRGIGVSLPDRVHRVVHDESRPVHERAEALLDHVSEHPDHWGMHWTTENRVAEDFAERSAQHEANEDQRGRYALNDFTWGHEPEYKDTPLAKPGTAVVFHAHEPSLDALETDGHRLSNGGVYGWSQHGEREVPVRDTHALDLKGLSWAPMHSADDVPGHGEYTHHDFGHEPRIAAWEPPPREYSAGRMLVSDIRRPGEGLLSERPYTQDELAADIRANGVQQPLAIEHLPAHGGPTTFNGLHRLDAAQRAGVADVPVVVKHRPGDYPPMTGRRPSTEEEFNSAYNLEREGRWAGEHTAALIGHFEAADYSLSHTAPSPAAGHRSLDHYAGGSPEDRVRIYRSAPRGTESVNTGDWVSLNPDYAHQHGRHATDPDRDWPVFTAEVPQKHVHWDENDPDEHGYNGPPIHHPDVHDEETGGTQDWDSYHDGHQFGQEAWAGASVHLSPEDHELVHDDCQAEDDRADALLNAARAQGSLRSARWRDDLYPARDDAEAHAAAHLGDAPEGHLTTAFTVHRNDEGQPERIGIHHYEASHDPSRFRRYEHIDDLPSWHYNHSEIGKIGTSREAAVQHQASGETAPEGHQIWAEPHGRSPVGDEVYHNMGHREPGDEHGSAWYQGISYHGPYHVIRHPQTRQVWVVDRHGRDASPTGGHYGNPERDGNWGEHQAWEHQFGLESAGPEAHRFGTPDEPRFNEMDKRTPAFPHSRVDPEDIERVNRPAARVHAPEGYSPSDEYHGSYEVVRHPETGGYHVVDNQGRHAMTGNPGGFKTQLQGERSRDYIERKQRSKEIGKGIADSIFNKGMDALDPGGTSESRQSEENMRTASEMMDRYHGGLGEIKFDDDEDGGAPYYEREHLRGNGTPSGWFVKHYGGAHADVYHRATGDESHRQLHFPEHPEDENHSMTPRLHPKFGDEHLAGALAEWHDDEEGGERKYLEANDPRISRWRKRHLGAAQFEVVAHFEDPEPPPFPVTAAADPAEEYGPQPKYQAPPDGLSQEEKDAHFERGRAERHGWTSRIRRGLGLGHLTHDRARDLGYYGDGSETPEQLYDNEGNLKVHRGWQPLPESLYHATTDMPSVREHGLKSRQELGQVRGKGLGAGPDDTISLTSDHGSAENILRAMHEHHDVVTGKKTPAQMIEEARAGHGAKKPFLHDLAVYSGETWNEGEPMPRGLDAKVRGVELKRGGYLHTPEEMAEREGPGWRPHPESDELKGRNGETLYNSWERDSSPERKREQASGLYRDFAVARAHAGGPEDPLFTGTDVHGFAAMNPAHFGIVHVRPRPGAQGFPISALHEWRTTTGDALEVHRAERLEHGHLKEAAVSRIAARYEPGLPNPQTGGDTWFHGTQSRPEDFVHGFSHNDTHDHDDEEMRGHLAHWNTLLGSHFAADHGVAEHFAGTGSSTDSHDEDDWEPGERASRYQEKTPESVIHARLHLRNPKVYGSEFDMDHEAYEHEYGERKNYISKHFEEGYEHEDPHSEDYDPDTPGEFEEWPLAARYRHDDQQPIERGQVQRRTWNSNPDMPEVPERTRWLNSHPDKAGIARRFKEHLESQGHDGILYGNEFEDHHATGSGKHHSLSAIIFHPRQAEITQHHPTGASCLSGEEAEHQRGTMPQPGQEELPGVEEHADRFPNGFLREAALVAHFEEPKTAAPVYYQQKLFHQQPDPTLHAPESGRHNPADPEGHLRYRKEHDEEYQPDTCPECGGDRKFREQHEDEHRAHLEDQDWYTDWDGMDMPSHIHRGMAVHLPQELHDYVHDESAPQEDRAKALARHLVGHPNSDSGNGLGHYWSESPDQSKGYAEGRPTWLRPEAGEARERTPVMVHAHFPGREHIETDPETLQHWKVLKYGYGRDNLEYPISEGAPVRLSGISWARPDHHHHDVDFPLDRDDAWTHHEFGGDGIQANAALAVVAHFEDDEEPQDLFLHGMSVTPEDARAHLLHSHHLDLSGIPARVHELYNLHESQHPQDGPESDEHLPPGVYHPRRRSEVQAPDEDSRWEESDDAASGSRYASKALPGVTAHFEDDDEEWDEEPEPDLEPAGHERDEHDFVHPMVRDRETGERFRSPFEEPRCLNCERASGTEQRHRPEDGHPVPGVQAAVDRREAHERDLDEGRYDRTRYCDAGCQRSHEEDRERGVSVHHTFQVGEREDAAPVDHEGLPALSGPFDEPVGRDSRYEVRNPSAEHRCHYCRNILPQYRKEASVTAGYDWETDEGPFTWDEIGHRHPALYGDEETDDYEPGNGGGHDIGDAAAELYHDRPGHPHALCTGECHPENNEEMVFHPRTVDVSRIDYNRVDRSERDPRVERARRGFESDMHRGKIPPMILVHRHGVYQVADGHHRANGAEQAHWPSVRAYVAYSPHEDEPFAGRDGEPPRKGPVHGAETSDRPRMLDHNGEPGRRISFPGFPHTADAGIPPREASLSTPEPTEHCGLDNPHAPHDWCRGTTFDEFYAGEPGFCGSTRAHPEHGECFGLEADLPQRSGPELEGGDEFRMTPRPQGQPHDPVFGSARGPVELDTARDHVLISSGPVDALVQAVAAISSWTPGDARDLPLVFTALASGLRRVGALVDEMPVHPLVAEAVHAMADGARTAAVYAADALPPEASWETGSSPNR